MSAKVENITVHRHRTNRKLPVSVDILNYQVFFTFSLTATHERGYSKSLSTHLSLKRSTIWHFLGFSEFIVDSFVRCEP